MYEKFCQLLQRANITPYKVSKETGVSQQTLSDWKNGKSIPKIDKLQKIADYFNVPLDWFTNDSISILPNFRIYKEVELFLIKKLAVRLQELSYNPLHKYCIQYAGNGHYFASIEEVYAYLQKRWSSKISTLTTSKLLELLDNAPVIDLEPRDITCKNYANNIHNSSIVQGDSVSSVKSSVKQSLDLLSSNEKEILRLFSKLNGVDQAKVIVYAAELKEKSSD